ncbi:MAG: PspC family transcriptional regulator [Bacteroidota bacterium]
MLEFRRLLEHSAFGVCTYLADRMGLHIRRVRLYFIYISCITLGSPLLLYLFTAFWLNLRQYLAEGKRRLYS